MRVCVDGKQRLTSIQKFLDGLVSNHFFWSLLSTHVPSQIPRECNAPLPCRALRVFSSRPRRTNKEELLVRQIRRTEDDTSGNP